MFKRYEPEAVQTAVPVTLKRTNGAVERGRIILPFQKTLDELLNGGAAFIEFQPYGGETAYLAKTEILSIEPSNVPKASDVNVRLHATNESVDPYDTLGVPRGAPRSEVKKAYHKLAKLYHPDRYANTELPEEVTVYLAGMARRVNAAYAAIHGDHFVKSSSQAA
jgi:DnaJ-domain-containing protein 1